MPAFRRGQKPSKTKTMPVLPAPGVPLCLALSRGETDETRGCRSAATGVKMSEASQFRQYAEEALVWVSQSTTEEEKRTLTDLACMWAQAALQSERIFGVRESAPNAQIIPLLRA
jgi:hypothetical protein